MAGHNKWSKIKHKKAVTDAQKSKQFGKLVRLITVEAKKAGGDINSPGLRAAVEKANRANMPKDNIDRAIKKASDPDTAAMEEVVYEAYGPSGVALIMTGLTDNRNRTSAELKHALAKHGASLAEPGAAAWAFEFQEDGYYPQTTIELSERESAKLDDIVAELEDLEDIQSVVTNAQ